MNAVDVGPHNPDKKVITGPPGAEGQPGTAGEFGLKGEQGT